MKAKTVRVVLPEPLVDSMDALSEQRCETRATLIREACAAYVASAAFKVREAEADRRYIEGYTMHPETLYDDDGSDWYEAFLKEERETQRFWQELDCSG